MKLGFAGGAREVGGSCICIRTGGAGILLDAGIRQGGNRDPLPDLRLIQEMGGIDAILISHAHMDHIGSLPLISRAYPGAPIYMTPMTMDLTRVLLQDSLKIMSSREEEIPLYGEAEAAAMMDRIVPMHEQAERELLPGITAVFYPAGHIAGAACIFLQTPEGSLFYSGDFSAFAQQTIEGIRLPKLRPDICIIESTYGDLLHANRQVEESRMIRLVSDAVSAGKKVLIPSFALGRAQEVILLIRSGINRGLIPKVPVYVDGMVRDICRIYRLHPSCLKGKLAKAILKGNDPFYSDEVQPVPSLTDRNELADRPGPAVFVASSGMLSGGPSVQYAEKIVCRPDGLVIITGYQDEEAPGRALLQLAEAAAAEPAGPDQTPSLSLSGRSVPVRAEVCRVGLSAHGDQGEILNLLSMLSPRDVFLVHGDAEVMDTLARQVTGEFLREVHLPVCGEVKEVFYRSPRRQAPRNWPWVMNQADSPDEAGMKTLRVFLLEHYPERQWTAQQLMGIWYGKPASDTEEINTWQKKLLDSAWFTSGEKNFFLFHPSTDEEISAALSPKEPTPQDLQSRAAELFGSLGYKKAGIHSEEKKVLLHFTFPDAVDLDLFRHAADLFEAETGWSVSIHPGTNHTAAQQLLHALFENRIAKTAYYESERSYLVTLTSGDPSDSAGCSRFRQETGWALRLSAGGAPDSGNPYQPPSEISCRPAGDSPVMEQNAAFAYIRNVCAAEEIPLQKVGIKTDHVGKYIELTFISPELGSRYADRISALSSDTGWRLALSPSVLQNLALPIAARAAEKAGLILKKAPSFLPFAREIQLKAQPSAPDAEGAVKAEILEKTGLHCRIVGS